MSSKEQYEERVRLDIHLLICTRNWKVATASSPVQGPDVAKPSRIAGSSRPPSPALRPLGLPQRLPRRPPVLLATLSAPTRSLLRSSLSAPCRSGRTSLANLARHSG